MTRFRSRRTPPRELPELMDQPDCDPGLLADALDVLGRTGRWLGGHRLMRERAWRLLRARRPGPLAVLDVGAGGGDGAVALDAFLRARDWRPRYTLGDLHELTVGLCRARLRSKHPELAERSVFVRLDGVTLPFADGSFDLAISALTLHHLGDRAAQAFLYELDRVAKLGWVVTDLRRSPVSLAAVRLLAATAWRAHAFPRSDGPVSVRRSFTPSEVRGLARRAGLDGAVIEPGVVRWAAHARAGRP